jgi:hypothetical protein
MVAAKISEDLKPHFRRAPLTDPWKPIHSKRTDKAAIIEAAGLAEGR